jgi:demethylmenaquinone methyltransferase/2-methoxy-6-polyprenyl-1,4-benzoquinol methylase
MAKRSHNQYQYPDSPPAPSREKVWLMFDRIAGKYDLLNHLLSLGFDLQWRKKVNRYLPEGTPLALLDLATGTGDQILSILRQNQNIYRAVGMDMAVKMLAIARKKMEKTKFNKMVEFKTGDAGEIDFPDNSFDSVTISFGIRNFIDLEKTLSGIRRVLKPSGRLLILEFSIPENKIIRWLHLFYLRKILPLIGTLISGDDYAYRYLNQTIETFPYGEAFCSFLRKCDLTRIRSIPLTFGVVTLYQAEK